MALPMMPKMPPPGMPPVGGDAMNLGSPMGAPSTPSPLDALASIKDKLSMGTKKKSLPGVGFKKPVGKVTKKAISSVRALKRKMKKKGKK